MSRTTETGLVGETHGPTAPIRLGPDAVEAGSASVRWQLMLVWLMRVLSLVWLAQGFSHWHSILVPAPSDLEILTGWRAASLVGFAVFDLLTAIGLWLVTPWGGVLWILNVALQMVVVVGLPGFFPGGRLILAIYAALVVVYFVITFQAGQEEEDRRD